MASDIVKHVDDSNFDQEVLKSSQPVLVDFWAPWCGPCKAIAPVLDQVAQENSGKVTVCKVNVDDSTETAAKYGIRGIPTLILFKDGQVVNQLVGAVPKNQITDMVAKVTG